MGTEPTVSTSTAGENAATERRERRQTAPVARTITPTERTPQELKLIADMRKRNPTAGLVVFWVKLRQYGYTRSVTGLYRLLRRQGKMPAKPPNPKYIPKTYEKNAVSQSADADRCEICAVVGDAKCKKFYRYTAIDEYSRFRYLETFAEHSHFSLDWRSLADCLCVFLSIPPAKSSERFL